MNLFSTVELAPRDPILGLTEAFNADNRPNKVNLGIGIYTDEHGKIPLLRAVHEAEKRQFEAASARGYLPIDGLHAYTQAVQKLLFGENSLALQQNRIVTVQTVGGTGALKTGADFIKRLIPNAPNAPKSLKIAISNPSWENHRALFEAAGFEVITYPYYDAATHGVNFDGLTDALNAYPPNTIVVFHACCHNPTGVDLTMTQWQRIIEIVKERELVPFLDIAYQGFSNGIEADASAIRLFSDASININTFVANSFSKTFSLYGERVGALSVITSSEDEAARVLSQLKRVIRTTYSNPPTHGAAIVAKVLNDATLRAQWEQELNAMRERICTMRHALVDKLKHLGVDRDFEFINRQRGMFSYSGLSVQQVKQLQSAFGIYAVSTGRICIAALNNKNLDSVANAIVQVF